MSASLPLNAQLPEAFVQWSVATQPDFKTPASEFPNLQSQVSAITSSISDDVSRLVVGRIMSELVLMLDYLSLVRSCSSDVEGGEEMLAILDTVHREASSLVDFIESNALRVERIEDALRDALDGAAFAIKLEVGRMFKCELAEKHLNRDEQEIQGSALYVQGVLTNCFQQSIVNLARVVDDSVTEARLFQDWKARQESSIVLCRDLSSLIRLTLNCETGNGLLEQLVNELKSFREGSMQSLIYRDWKQYRAISEQVIESINNGGRPIELLHQLRCYLETLLAHVKARAVLADLTLEPSGVDQMVSIA